MAKVQRVIVIEPVLPAGVCVGFKVPAQDLSDMGGESDEWELLEDDGGTEAWQEQDGGIRIKAGGEDLAVWRTREQVENALAELRRGVLSRKMAGFLDTHTADITKREPFLKNHSLEEMMGIVQGRALDADCKCCERFLNEEVPWEDVTVPDPRGWANQ